MDRLRFGRQILVPEIGEHGQALLCKTEVPLVSSGFARTIEERYLVLAGVKTRSETAETTAVPSLDFTYESARDVGMGALCALTALRRLLGLDEKARAR